ncbi:MAG: cell wall metabolism sensor histidine kinase WalK [Candidatus Pacebacteria bacterium]|nr:cell wall metabolism sensor histidine kinase WalK [Candidatus Paceibacterota bacterium]
MSNEEKIKLKIDNRDIQKKAEDKELEYSEEEKNAALINLLEDAEKSRERAIEEKRKTEAIISNFTDGLLFFDNQGYLKIFNPQAEIFFEVKAIEVLEKKTFFLKSISSLKVLIDFLETKQERIFREEIEINENLILEISSLPILGKEGKRAGILLILHDVTREKQVQKMKTEFVSIAAHQLRTPLSAIKWTLKMLLDGDLGPLNKEQIEFVNKNYISNERMISLINDLLNVTRIEEGRYLYSKQLIDFYDLIHEIVNTFEEEFKKKKIKISFQKAEEKIPLIKVDVEKMQLAVHNLIDNAIRYTSSEGKIIISLKLIDQNIEFSIQDTGIGIPKNQEEKIFTKFFRGINIMKIDTEGTGLGLFITKNIIEAHDGKIWFESEENKGTTFYFTLPC